MDGAPESLIKRLNRFFQGKFVRDTVILQAGDMLNLGVAFVTSVMLARLLSPSGYGVYALITSLFGMLSFTGDLGLAPATITQLAESLSGNDREAGAEYCGYFVKLSLVLGLALAGLGVTVGPVAADQLYGKPEIGLMAGLLLLDQLLGLPRNLVRVAWQAGRMMNYLAVFEVCRGVLRFLLIGLFLLLGYGVWGVVAAELIGAVVASLVGWRFYAALGRDQTSAFPTWGQTLSQAVRVPLSKHFGFGLKIILDRNVVRILEAAPFLILGRFAATTEVGFLRLAWGAINLPLSLLTALANNLAARLPQLSAQGDLAGFWRTFFKSSLAGGAISVTGVGLFCLLAPWLVRLLYGEDYLPAVPYIYILALGAAGSGFFAGIGALYRTVRRVGLLAVVNLAQLALYLPAAYFVIRAFGADGGAAFIAFRVLALNLVAFVLAMTVIRRSRS